MNRKTYQEPTMKVVKLQNTQMLMTSDGGNASVQDYKWNSESEEVKAQSSTVIWDEEW